MTTHGGRVAIVGASGIGRHHAKWWHLEGARVCAFAGTSTETVAKARAELERLFPFDGNAYTDVEEMLERERPDIVDVCSPPQYHYEHAVLALDAGARVFCEKPFVYRPDASSEQIMAQARDLVARARERRLDLGLCVQYGAGARVFREMWEERFGAASIDSFSGRLGVPARGRAAGPQRVWMDLGPHPLSVAQALFPGGEPDWGRLEVAFEGYEASARFPLRKVQGREVSCEVTVCNVAEQPHVREFRLNDYTFRIGAGTDDDGHYCALFQTSDEERREPDLMRQAIRSFLAGRPVTGPEEALRNTEWLLRISERARSGR